MVTEGARPEKLLKPYEHNYATSRLHYFLFCSLRVSVWYFVIFLQCYDGVMMGVMFWHVGQSAQLLTIKYPLLNPLVFCYLFYDAMMES